MLIHELGDGGLRLSLRDEGAASHVVSAGLRPVSFDGGDARAAPGAGAWVVEISGESLGERPPLEVFPEQVHLTVPWRCP